MLAPQTVWPSEGEVELLLHPVVTQPHRHLRPTPSSAVASSCAGAGWCWSHALRFGAGARAAPDGEQILLVLRHRRFVCAAASLRLRTKTQRERLHLHGTITTPPNSVGVVRRRECRPCTAVRESTNAVAPPSAHLPSGASPVDQPHVHLRPRLDRPPVRAVRSPTMRQPITHSVCSGLLSMQG